MTECIALVPINEHANKSATLVFEEDGIFVLGRNSESGLDLNCFPDSLALLSRAHAKVTIVAGSLRIEPMGTNKIYVNCYEYFHLATELHIGGSRLIT